MSPEIMSHKRIDLILAKALMVPITMIFVITGLIFCEFVYFYRSKYAETIFNGFFVQYSQVEIGYLLILLFAIFGFLTSICLDTISTLGTEIRSTNGSKE